ncbi:hypothetical protein [uncultured Ilyobacter sp.]|uniref:hypothetical protein n=1 Tax=uncultured Ilyobacter sp. TaxID=544433 RepID=UPI0029C78413|nr:hypothetical protein [uncultured Ilyobacter sp.]
MGIKITDDRTLYDKIFKELNILINSKLLIRIDPNATYEDGTKVENVGMWMEFGWDEFNVHYPSRPFFRSAFDANADRIQATFERELNKLLDGKVSAIDLMNTLGKFVVRKVREMLEKGSYDPLAESTIKIKGSSQPLIDTRNLLTSIEYKIEVG